MAEYGRYFVLGVLFLILCHLSACGANECISNVKPPPLPPADDEYRLMFSNGSGQLVELFVDEESDGILCPRVKRVYVGNFKRSSCSVIYTKLFDLNRIKKLDDCDYLGYPTCIDNNIDGKICFDTTGSLVEVEAFIR